MNVEDEVAGVGLLAQVAVHTATEGQIVGVGHLVGGDQRGPDGPECVVALRERELPHGRAELLVAVADVVAAGQAGDVLPGLGGGHALAAPPDGHHQFHLVVHHLQVADRHVVAGAADAGRELGHDVRLAGDRQAGLLRVAPVVECHGDDLPGPRQRRPQRGLVEFRPAGWVDLGGQCLQCRMIRQVGGHHGIRTQGAARRLGDVHRPVVEHQAGPSGHVGESHGSLLGIMILAGLRGGLQAFQPPAGRSNQTCAWPVPAADS